jgi:hypothetical protein
MEKSEEKIIDLVDVIAEPDPNRVPKALPVAAPEKRVEFPSESGNRDFGKMVQEEVEQNLHSMVREEVERILQTMVGEKIETMIKEILTQEIEKAIAREIEGLKKAK